MTLEDQQGSDFSLAHDLLVAESAGIVVGSEQKLIPEGKLYIEENLEFVFFDSQFLPIGSNGIDGMGLATKVPKECDNPAVDGDISGLWRWSKFHPFFDSDVISGDQMGGVDNVIHLVNHATHVAVEQNFQNAAVFRDYLGASAHWINTLEVHSDRILDGIQSTSTDERREFLKAVWIHEIVHQFYVTGLCDPADAYPDHCHETGPTVYYGTVGRCLMNVQRFPGDGLHGPYLGATCVTPDGEAQSSPRTCPVSPDGDPTSYIRFHHNLNESP